MIIKFLCGGLGSTIAGGDFWTGVRQGVITSGLNHLAHGGYKLIKKHSFDMEIEKAFGSKSDKPVTNFSSEEIVTVIKKVPTLNKFYNKFLNKFGSVKINYEDVLIGDDARTYADHENKTLDNLTFYRGSMQSYRWLSTVILHEFGHVNSIYKGFVFQNVKKYTPRTGIAIDEIYAYKFGKHHGGTPFNPAYEANVNFLKNTIWKIDANSLKLPSFD